MALRMRKIEVPESEIRPDLRKELEGLWSRIESSDEAGFLEISLPDHRDVYLFTSASLAAYVHSIALHHLARILDETFWDVLSDRFQETVCRYLQSLQEHDLEEVEGELELEDLLHMLEPEFIERLERIEQASKDWAAAEERGDLVSPEQVRARRKARRADQGRH